EWLIGLGKRQRAKQNVSFHEIPLLQRKSPCGSIYRNSVDLRAIRAVYCPLKNVVGMTRRLSPMRLGRHLSSCRCAERLVERGLADPQSNGHLPDGQALGDHILRPLQLIRNHDRLASSLAPRAAAAARPARVRSWMRSRSNCPRAAKRWNTSRPPGVVVSIASVRDRK